MGEEYKKSCSDVLDWVKVDQLHAATLQISNNCFEFKKLCIGFLAAAMTILIKLTENSVDHSLFTITLMIVIGFWLADSTAYYYQRTVRISIEKKMNAIAQRNNIDNYDRTITEISLIRSIFNGSMYLYYFLSIIIFGCWISYILGWIK